MGSILGMMEGHSKASTKTIKSTDTVSIDGLTAENTLVIGLGENSTALESIWFPLK